MTEGNRTKLITKRLAIAKRIVNGALKGNTRQQEFLFKYMRELGIPDPFGITTHDDAEFTRALEEFQSKERVE